jgi:hypothetical protein
VAELGSVISSTTAPARDKWAVLVRAYAVPKSASFSSALQLGLQQANEDDLKYRIQAELMSRDDLSQLDAAQKLLLTGTLNIKQKELFLSVIANQIKNPKRPQCLLVSCIRATLKRAGLPRRGYGTRQISEQFRIL